MCRGSSGRSRADNVRGSALTILDANVLGASCSRVCPVEVLCEGSCVMHRNNKKPIEIGRLQRFAMESFHAAGGKLPLQIGRGAEGEGGLHRRGAGSLACAAELRQQGFQVTVFDRRALPGGLNTYGVAEYKLRARGQSRGDRDDSRAGRGVPYETEIRTQQELEQLEREFDRYFLAWGWERCIGWAFPETITAT